MPPVILRLRSLMASSAVRATLVTGMYGTFFLGSLFLERVRGFSAIEIGLAFLPMPMTVGIMSVSVTTRRLPVPGTASATTNPASCSPRMARLAEGSVTASASAIERCVAPPSRSIASRVRKRL